MTIELLLEDQTKVTIDYTEMGETGFKFQRWIDGKLKFFDISLTDDEIIDLIRALKMMRGRKDI